MVDRLILSEANERRIRKVERCFGKSGMELLVPGRVLVGVGKLTKICRKSPKKRMFFLFNDLLIYGNIVINKVKYNKQRVIPLEQITLEPREDNSQFCNSWLIRTATKSFVVYAKTQTEKVEWMVHIKKCVEDLLRKSGKKPLQYHAAPWIPDAQASRCMHCRKTEFSMFVRRHHCRNCGLVACASCSSKKCLLPNQKKPVRVCNGCYENLCNAVLELELPKMPAVTANSQLSYSTCGGGDAYNCVESSGDEDSEAEATMFESCNQADDDESRFYGDNTRPLPDDENWWML